MRRALPQPGNCRHGQDRSSQNGSADPKLLRPAMAGKTQSDSSEKKKVAQVVDRALKPGAEGGIGELDPRQHSVDFIAKPGQKKKQRASNREQIGTAGEAIGGKAGHQQANQRYRV